MDTLWQRTVEGLHTAWLGGEVPPAPAGSGIAVVRVDCSRTPGPLAPIQAARRHIHEALGVALEPLATPDTSSGVRRHLLGEPGLTATAAANLTYALFLFGEGSEAPCALVFDSLEEADRSSLEVIRGLIAPGVSCPVPVILGFRERPRSPFAQSLLTELLQAAGPDGVLEAASAMEPQPPSKPVDVTGLPRGVRRVVRAAPWSGQAFEVEDVAMLLRVDPLVVLECLQEAVDLGVPLDDRGRGHLRLSDSLLEQLRSETIPSLAEAWNLRRAELLTPERSAAAGPMIGGASEEEVAAPASSDRLDPVSMDGAAPSSSWGGRTSGDDPHGELDEPQPGLHERAAEALAAAGDYEASARRLLDAARDAVALAAFPEAMDYGREGLELINSLPVSPPRRLLRVELLAELGRVQWLGAHPHRALTLAGALESLDDALRWIREGDPAELEARLRTLVADVCYELGDHASLERSLAELKRASDLLEEDGRPIDAARLINDQAAVYVRIGDPLRANRLLTQSRSVFAGLAPSDEIARIELAETDHLIARLPLHVPARPGKADDAWTLAAEHAAAAEACYADLGMHREAARVWETLGRIEVARGEAALGAQWFQRALSIQEPISDVTGLARTTEGLARAFGALGRFDEALTLLDDSTILNLEKGSPVGLAYDRRALDALEQAMDAELRRRLLPRIAEVAERISAGATRLGVVLHGD